MIYQGTQDMRQDLQFGKSGCECPAKVMKSEVFQGFGVPGLLAGLQDQLVQPLLVLRETADRP